MIWMCSISFFLKDLTHVWLICLCSVSVSRPDWESMKRSWSSLRGIIRYNEITANYLILPFCPLWHYRHLTCTANLSFFILRVWTFRRWRLNHASEAAPPPWCPPASPSCPSSGKSQTPHVGRFLSVCLPLPPSRPCHRAKCLTFILLWEENPCSLPPNSEHSSDLKHICSQLLGRGHGWADWDQWALTYQTQT